MEIQIPVENVITTYEQVINNQGAQITELTKKLAIAEMQVQYLLTMLNEKDQGSIESE